MYLAIIMLPLLSGGINGLLGRKLGHYGSRLLGCVTIIICTLLSIVAYYEIAISESPLSIYILDWIDTEYLEISWALNIDTLSISIYIPVLIVSSCVHIYTMEYMSEDPHNTRFYSYLSLFTFFMLVLISGDNLLLIFIGWEGREECLKCFYTENTILSLIMNRRGFFNKSYNSLKRIGPHSEEIISIIIGSVLGDSHLEKRKEGVGTRIHFEQCSNNVEYLMWFHKYIAERGYCSTAKPKLHKRIRKEGKIFYHYRINSYTFSSLNWIHEMFYKDGVKIIPQDIEKYLTPLALAIWYMDDGSVSGLGAKIATNCFKEEELKEMCKKLKIKYNLNTSIQSGGVKKGYVLYIKKDSMETLSKIIKEYMVKSLHYKLNKY